MALVKWYVDGCYHSHDEPKQSLLAIDYFDAPEVVRALVESWWHTHGDYATQFDVVIVSPPEWLGRYPVEVESVPHFVIGKPQ